MIRFSLTSLYSPTLPAKILDALVLAILVLIIVASPLPFGAVEAGPLFLIESLSATCFGLWLIKLLFWSNRRQLQKFREIHMEEKREYKRAPFMQRHNALSFGLNKLTFGNWPRKNAATNLVEAPCNEVNQPNFFSVFGFPVRNTGIERVAVLFLLLLLLQTVPLPNAAGRFISPKAADLYESAAQAAGTAVTFHPLSVDRYQTFAKFLECAAYFMIYLVIVNGVPSRKYFRIVLLAFLFSAFFQAAYGVMEYLTGHQHIFFYAKKVNEGVATGSFINRNHYALYLELSLSFTLAIVAVCLDTSARSDVPFSSRLSQVSKNDGGKIILLTALLILVLFAILTSLSRSGVLFTAISTAVFFVLYYRVKKGAARTLLTFGAILMLAIVLLSLNWAPLFSRFQKIGTEFTASRARFFLYKDTLKIFEDYPFAGSGGGTFMQVFPGYQSFVTNDNYRYAHNDYLQLFAETGIPGLLFAVLLGCKIFRRLWRMLGKPVTEALLLQIAAFTALLSLALHSFTDFGIQIPAIAVAGTAIFGLFWKSPLPDEKII